MTKMTTPKLIALFGATGTGKTTFVNDASGDELQVGRTLAACTKEVTCSSIFQVDGEDIILVDTPGFDDTRLPDTTILTRIASFLTATYEKGHRLTGVIFLHRMTDNRVGGVSRRTFKLFRKLCGSDTLSNVVIVTNIWSNPQTMEEFEREKELQENPEFFQPALQKGAQLARRLTKGTDSAHDIIRLFLDKQPVVMNIQRQIVDNHQPLFETDAAGVLDEELVEVEKKHQEEMEQIKEELKKAEANNVEAEEIVELQQDLEETEQESLRLAKEMESLRHGIEQERAQWEQKIHDEEKRRRDLEREYAELGAQLAELRDQAKNASGERRNILMEMIAGTLAKMYAITEALARLSCVLM